MDRLRGRSIIVTGATGIAAASARRFAAEGAELVVISRTGSSCRSLVKDICHDGGSASFVVADLTDGGAAREAVAEAIARLRRVDGLFNVAGGSGERLGDGPLHELTPEAYEATMRLNATTHVTVSAPVLRAMLAQSPDADGQRGSIVNMGSVLATRPVPELFATHAYATAKGAIAALTTTSAAYYAPRGHPHQHGGTGIDDLAHVRARRCRRSHAGVLQAQAAAVERLHPGRGRGHGGGVPSVA